MSDWLHLQPNSRFHPLVQEKRSPAELLVLLGGGQPEEEKLSLHPHLCSCCCQSDSLEQISAEIEETAAQVNVGRLAWPRCGCSQKTASVG